MVLPHKFRINPYAYLCRPMISYNPKDWFSFIFRFHKSDTFRKLLPVMLGIGVYCAVIAWVEMDYLHLREDHQLKNISIMHTSLTFVISMLLVFRTNSAYDRWWEGRKLWGSLVNNSRNLALKLNALLPKEKTTERFFFVSMISNYPFVLKHHLRNAVAEKELLENDVFNTTQLTKEQHNPNYVAKLIIERITLLHQQGMISPEQLLYLNNELSSFTDICGACERIKNTPIPFTYSIFIKKFIFFYIMSLPLTLVFSLGYYCIPVVAFIFYVLASLELIAEEIEDPFGSDSNDLPTDAISKNIRKTVYEILEVKAAN
ncbi:MAG: bestrophin family ion channel [Chitinophagales bacterium]|nr:bestrophin family ion channel [Chitinophagales bacterium]